MKKEKILKALVVLILGVVLISMSTSVYAVLSDADGLTDYYDDKTNTLDTNTNTNTDTNTNTNTNSNSNTNTNLNTNTNTNTATNTDSSNYNTNLPKAGAKENTMLGVTVTILAITAVYTYKKVKEYKNI